MTLVMSFAGVIHEKSCRSIGRAYKWVAPDIDEAEVAAFLQARHFVGCGNCLRDYREAE